jgi:hypothetical protein
LDFCGGLIEKIALVGDGCESVGRGRYTMICREPQDFQPSIRQNPTPNLR